MKALVNQVSVAEETLDVSESQEQDKEETLDIGEEWTMFQSKGAEKASRACQHRENI